MMGILTLLIKWVPLCQYITLVAVKGKPGGGSDAGGGSSGGGRGGAAVEATGPRIAAVEG